MRNKYLKIIGIACTISFQSKREKMGIFKEKILTQKVNKIKLVHLYKLVRTSCQGLACTLVYILKYIQATSNPNNQPKIQSFFGMKNDNS